VSMAKLVGKAQTVLGAIDAINLGITLPHEHCLIDMSLWFMEPSTATGKLVAHQPLSYENLWFVRYHPYSNRDNIQLLNEQEAIDELSYFKRAGGSTLVDMTNTGCYIEYDTFSFEGWMPENCRMVLSEDNPVKADLPNDAARINEIMALVEEGFLNQILISQDHCFKSRLCRYGGPGYAHILNNVVPLMRQKGITEEQIHTILVENPKRLLSFV